MNRQTDKRITMEMFRQFAKVVYKLSCGAHSIKREDTAIPGNLILFVGDFEAIPVFNQLRRFVPEIDAMMNEVESAPTRHDAIRHFLKLVDFAEKWRDEMADSNGWPANWIE